MAAGAAVSPPAPWPTSSTATATLRVAGGREGHEPGVGVRLVLLGLRGRGRAGLERRRVLGDRAAQLRGAGLARHGDARDLRPPMPVPDLTTARMKRATTRAVRSLVARVSLPCEPRESVGATRRPRRPIVAATVASSSGVASTLPWPIAVEPTARSSPISSAAGIVERAAPQRAGVLVEAEPLRRLDEPLRRRARRPSARTRSCRSRRTTAAASRRRPRRGRSGARRPRAWSPSAPGTSAPGLTTLASSAPASVTILNVEPGGWGAEKAMPESPSTSPVAGRSTAIPPKRPAERLDRGALDVGVDRGAHVRAGARLGAGDHARAGAQHAAGAARQALVELALEPVEPDRRALGHAAAGELRLALRRRRADAPGDLGRRAARGPRAGPGPWPAACRRAPGSRRARPASSSRCSRSPARSPGNTSVRAPVDARAVLLLDHRQAHLPRQPPEDPRLHANRQLVGVVVGLARRRRRATFESVAVSRGSPVGAHEALEAGAAARAIGQQRVHRRVVPALPGGGPLARDRGLGRLVAQAHEGARRRRRPARRSRAARSAPCASARPPAGAGGPRARGRRTGDAGHHASMPERSASHASPARKRAERTAPVASLA